jgi:BirA family transcriptional regulator, biotin operon repressor / biotin---[acetyl-CoA-carboxylase] ligase
VVAVAPARPLTFTLLRELSADHFTSGALLAAKHGVSRSAISDALKDAAALGVHVFSLTRRGYRLAEPLALLDISQIRQRLGQDAHRLDIQLVDVIDSTNTALLAQAANGAVSGTCLAAELQVAGRGRRGRQWVSALGASLTFSLLWRFDRGAAGLGGLSLVVGVAVADALRALGVAAQLKWPNDIVMNDHKLGGVLIETQGDMLGPTMAVIGIGLNVRLPEALRDAIDQPVTDIATEVQHAAVTSPALNRNVLLATVLIQLVRRLQEFEREGFAGLRDQWRALNVHQGQQVQVLSGIASYRAKVIDIDKDGALIVEYAGQQRALTAAEISIQPTR